MIKKKEKFQLIESLSNKYPVNKADTAKNIVPNVLNREFKAEKTNYKWSTDITYLYYGKKSENRVYLSAIKDLCTNEIISYKCQMQVA